MAPRTWAFRAPIAAEPSAVYAWLAQFRQDDHDTPAFLAGSGQPRNQKRPATRKVTVLSPTQVRLVDTWNGRSFESTVTLDPSANLVRIDGQYGYHATWAALPAAGGTLLTVEGSLAPRGLQALLVPLFTRGLEKEMAADFNGHLADLKNSLGLQP